MLQTVFRRSLHGERIGKTCFGSVYLTESVQNAIVGLFDLVNDLAMGVVESEVCRQEVSFGSADSIRSRAKVKNRIAESQARIDVGYRPAIKTRAGENNSTIDSGECRCG